ncbi:Trypsin-2 [Blattella germanica]|nr:Trypsin-2 [Blattella germanica]
METIQYFRARVGTSLKNGGYLHEISQSILHPEYKGSSTYYDYDVALLKMKTPFNFNSEVQPITLNKNPIITAGIATITGWGVTIEGGEKSVRLQKVQVPIMPNWECRKRYEGRITQNMFCAGRAARSACFGDSGGPVVYGGNQIGIVSWGTSCTRPDYSGVYANVHSLRGWIHKTSGV